MYLPAHFEETRPDVLAGLLREHPLATLVTLGSEGLTANHIPLEYDPEPAPYGTLRGHVARANPVWRDFTADLGVLAIFQGPQAYVTPNWYPTRAETGKVVPTFNYMVVHAQGPLRIVDDPAWVRALVQRLTDNFEATEPKPWRVEDAPADFIEGQLRAIVGIEIPIRKLTGKWKVSQNRPPVDRAGVIQGLREREDSNAQAIAKAVEEALGS
jgi:transcriptional regulator